MEKKYSIVGWFWPVIKTFENGKKIAVKLKLKNCPVGIGKRGRRKEKREFCNLDKEIHNEWVN